MAGLTDKAGGEPGEIPRNQPSTEQSWQDGMLRRMDTLRREIRTRSPEVVAERSRANLQDNRLLISYWGQTVQITWPDLEASYPEDGAPCPTFDLAMLLYYLHQADGTPIAHRWISFRELPNGAFYNLAYQRYSGEKIAQAYGRQPEAFHAAAQTLEGIHLPALAEHAYAFQPLPQVRLAAAVWPGDEDFPAQASVLFDAAASHYLVTDALGLLGGGLASRLIRAGFVDRS